MPVVGFIAGRNNVKYSFSLALFVVPHTTLYVYFALQEIYFMHEMSIAMNVVEIVTSQALQNEAQKINSISLDIGCLAGVMIDSLEFCFTAVCKGTIAEGAELQIDEISAQGRCGDCSEEFKVESYLTACPSCGGFKIDIIQGQELKIRTINVD